MAIKNIFYNLSIYLSIYLFVLVPIKIKAQTIVSCDDVAISLSAKESTCIANGSVTASLTGSDVANLQNIQYSLNGTDNNGNVVNRQPQTSNKFENLLPGTYSVTMDANCANIPSNVIHKTSSSINVTRNYTPFQVNDIFYLPAFFTKNDGKVEIYYKPNGEEIAFTLTDKSTGTIIPQNYINTSSNRVYFYNIPPATYTLEAKSSCYTVTREVVIERRKLSDRSDFFIKEKELLEKCTDNARLRFVFKLNDGVNRFSSSDYDKFKELEYALQFNGESLNWKDWDGDKYYAEGSTSQYYINNNILIIPLTKEQVISLQNSTAKLYVREKGITNENPEGYTVFPLNEFIHQNVFSSFNVSKCFQNGENQCRVSVVCDENGIKFKGHFTIGGSSTYCVDKVKLKVVNKTTQEEIFNGEVPVTSDKNGIFNGQSPDFLIPLDVPFTGTIYINNTKVSEREFTAEKNTFLEDFTRTSFGMSKNPCGTNFQLDLKMAKAYYFIDDLFPIQIISSATQKELLTITAEQFKNDALELTEQEYLNLQKEAIELKLKNGCILPIQITPRIVNLNVFKTWDCYCCSKRKSVFAFYLSNNLKPLSNTIKVEYIQDKTDLEVWKLNAKKTDYTKDEIYSLFQQRITFPDGHSIIKNGIDNPILLSEDELERIDTTQKGIFKVEQLYCGRVIGEAMQRITVWNDVPNLEKITFDTENDCANHWFVYFTSHANRWKNSESSRRLEYRLKVWFDYNGGGARFGEWLFYEGIDRNRLGNAFDQMHVKLSCINILTGKEGFAVDTIIYQRDNRFVLDKTSTLIYKCDNEQTLAIYAKGLNGNPPYHYELWNENGTQKISGTDGSEPTLSDYDLQANQVAAWKYGELGKSYMIKLRDKCGSSFQQKVTLSDIFVQGRIAYVGSPVCRTFHLFAQAIGNATYKWKNPNGEVISTERNPIVTNGTPGRYTVEITVPECGNLQIYTVDVVIPEPLKPGTITPITKPIPIGSNLNITVTSPTDGVLTKTDPITSVSETMVYKYQWQESKDGKKWYDIIGATEPNYTPNLDEAKTYYYRRNVEDFCGWTMGETLMFSTYNTWIPVNPHLMSVPWSPTP